MSFSRLVRQALRRRSKRRMTPKNRQAESLEERVLLTADPIGDPALVNQGFTSRSQRTHAGASATVLLDDGRSVVVYSGSNSNDASGVYIRMLDSEGNPLGGIRRVNQSKYGHQNFASVATNDESIVVTWRGEGHGDPSGVFASIYDMDLKAIRREIPVNTTVSGAQKRPDIAIDEGGRFVVTWAGKGTGDSSGIFARLFDVAGDPLGDEFRVNTATANPQTHPSIDVTPSGQFAIAWRDTDGIFLQRYDAAGDPSGGQTLVNSTPFNNHLFASVAMDDVGNLAVAWSGQVQGDTRGILMQRFLSDGTPQGNEELVNTTTARNQTYPSISMSGDGRAIVAWTSYAQDGNRYGTYRQEFSATGEAVGGEILVNTTTAGHQRYPSVSMNDAGDFTAVWSGKGIGDGSGVYARGFEQPDDQDTDPPTLIAGLSNDTGVSATDGLTNDSVIDGVVTDNVEVVSLTASLNAAAPVDVDFDATGDFVFDPELPLDGTADGTHTVRFEAHDAAGNSTTHEVTFLLDTIAPLVLDFELDPAFDSPPVGDQITTFDRVTFLGTTEPSATVTNHMTGDEAIAGQFGQFLFGGVPLAIGANPVRMTATDGAGNAYTNSIPFTRESDETFDLDEVTDRVSRTEIPVVLGPNSGGTRTIEFDFATAFDTSDSSSAIPDTFSVYLFDQNSERTLIDRGINGESLFAVDANGASTAPETPEVTVNGNHVTIDVTRLGDFADLGTLVLELLNGDGDTGSTATVTNLTGTFDPTTASPLAIPPLRAIGRRADDANPEVWLSPTSDVAVLADNLRFDAHLSQLALDLRVRNDLTVTLAPDVTVAITGLPGDAFVADASGVLANADRHFSFENVIPAAGLLPGEESGRLTIRVQVADPETTVFAPTFQAYARPPVLEIFEDVLNNYAFEPYRGAMKGAEGVRQTGAGNAWDTSSFVIEELEARGVPAKYAFDRAQVPLDEAINWLGARNTAGALDILRNATLNPTEIVEDGETTALEFDHAWVWANIALPGESARWRNIDASIRRYEYQQGIPDIVDHVPFDFDAYVSGERPENTAEFYAQQVTEYLELNHPGKTLADVPYRGTLVPQHFESLPHDLPFTFDGTALTADSIPVHETLRIQIKFETTINGRTDTYADRTISVPDDGLKRWTVTWEFDPELGRANVPKIRVGGDMPAGGRQASGDILTDMKVFVYYAGDSFADFTYTRGVNAGDVVGLVVDANQISQDVVNDRQDFVNEAGFDISVEPERDIGGLLNLIGAQYMLDARRDVEFVLGLTGARRGGNGVLIADVVADSPHYTRDFDQPIITTPNETVINALFHAPMDILDGADDRKQAELALQTGADHERSVFRKTIARDAVNAIRVLQAANDAGIPVFTIDESNRAELEPQLSFTVRNNVRLLLDDGFTVTVPRDEVTIGDKTGSGFRAVGPEGFFYAIAGEFGSANGGRPVGPRIKPVEDFCEHPTSGSLKQGRRRPGYVDVSGNLIRSALDIELPAIGISLDFERFYHSDSLRPYDSTNTPNGGFGLGWNHTWGHRLLLESNGDVTWVTPEHHPFRFENDGEDVFTTPELLAGTLTKLPDDSYEYRNKDGLTRHFSSTGVFLEVRDRFGNSVTLDYDSEGLLESVNHQTSGVSLQFTHTDNRITSIRDYAGRTWSYDYGTVAHPRFGSGHKVLAQVTSPSDLKTEAVVTRYGYIDDQDFGSPLKRITDPDGLTETFEFYPNAKVYRSSHPETGTDTFYYDNAGRSTTLVNSRGFRWQTDYDEQAQVVRESREDDFRTMVQIGEFAWQDRNLISETDALGQTTTYVYDTLDNLTQMTDADGNITDWTYGDFSLPLTMTEPGGRVTTHEYDVEGNEIRLIDAEGNITTATYDDLGQQLTVTSPRAIETGDIPGFTTTFAYNSLGEVTSIATGLPAVETFEYDTAGNLTRFVDANGNESTIDYDLLDRPIRQADALGGVARTVWDTLSRPVHLIDELGRSTAFDYDRINRTEIIVNSDSTATHTVYDTMGNVTEITDELNRTIEFTFDARERLVKVTQPDETFSTTTYDNNDRIVSLRDANGHITTFAYDVLNRVVAVTDAVGGVSSMSYDPFGNVIRVTDALGRTILSEYDAIDRLARTTDALGGVTQTVYDANSNPTSITDVLGRTTTMAWDVDDRLVSTTNPLGGTESLAYDAVGNVLASADENGHVSRFKYDALHRNVSVTDPEGETSRTSYDAVGKVVATEDRLGRITTTAYDERDRPTTSTDPLGGFVEWIWDDAGNLTKFRDKRGSSTNYEYDELNREVLMFDALGRPTETAYDNVGNIVAITDELNRTTQFQYDGLDRLIEVTDATGNSSQTTYDAVGNVIDTTDRLGRVTQFEYDDLDRLTRTTNALGGVRQISYDAFGNVLDATDELGRVVQYDHDGLNRVIRRTDPLGGVSTSVYDAVGNLTSGTDELGRTTQFVYDDNDRLRQRIDALGGVSELVYDANDNVTASGDELGRVTQFEYDDLDRVIRTTDALGGQRTQTYDQTGNVTSSTDELGRTTTFRYDRLNRPITSTDALGGVTSFGYDAVDNLTVVSDPLGQVTQYQYDNLNRQVQTVDALGGVSARSWDAVGNLLAVSDELGRTTTSSYDGLNRMVVATDPLGHSTTNTYDAAGNMTRSTDALGRETTFAYDALNRLAKTTDELDGVVALTYDAVGNPTSTTDEIGRTSTQTWDALNRLKSATDPLGNTNQWTYDAVGNMLQMIDGRGQITTQAYDGLNRMLSVSDPLNGVTSYAYDATDNLLSITDPVGNVTQYDYDDLNRPVTSTNPLGDARTFEYDAVGNLTGTTDRNGREIDYTYDVLNRRTAEDWLDEVGSSVRTFSYTYDAADQLSSVADPASVYSYLYDDAGRTTQVSNAGTAGVPAVVFDYVWDDVNNLLSRSESIDTAATALTAWTFDDLDRPISVAQSGLDSSDKRVNLSWDAASQSTGIDRFADLAGTQLVAGTVFTYDTAGRLTDLTHANGPVSLAAYTWTFDAADRLVQTTSPDGTTDYSYDDRDQLIAADHSVEQDETYTYDANGNRTLTGYETGTDNRLLSDGTFDYEYDAEGNRTRRTDIATGEVTDYEWDYRNRLVGITRRDSGGVVQMDTTYLYDVFDNRIGRTVDADGDGPATAETERLVHDGEHIALSFDESGNRTHRYLHGPAVDQIFADEDAVGDILWPLTDHLGSVRDLADAGGTVVNHIVYDSYGQVLSESDPSVDHRFSFTGRELDEETDQFYYRARYYDPAVGRFVSQDPITFEAGDANLYRYVSNQPVSASDPSGLIKNPDDDPNKKKKLKAQSARTHKEASDARVTSQRVEFKGGESEVTHLVHDGHGNLKYSMKNLNSGHVEVNVGHPDSGPSGGQNNDTGSGGEQTGGPDGGTTVAPTGPPSGGGGRGTPDPTQLRPGVPFEMPAPSPRQQRQENVRRRTPLPGVVAKVPHDQKQLDPGIAAPDPFFSELIAELLLFKGLGRLQLLQKVPLPKIQLPKIQLPKIQLPKIQLPKIQLPKIQLPKIQLPKIGQKKTVAPNPTKGRIHIARSKMTDRHLSREIRKALKIRKKVKQQEFFEYNRENTWNPEFAREMEVHIRVNQRLDRTMKILSRQNRQKKDADFAKRMQENIDRASDLGADTVFTP